VALAECSVGGGLGARVDLTGMGADAETSLFGEGPGGVVVAGPREAVEAIPGATLIGEVGGTRLEFASPAGSLVIEVERAREIYERAIPDRMS
jgi:phosphoribosylformylglycinamidine (FGAM) synthase-like enzyme